MPATEAAAPLGLAQLGLEPADAEHMGRLLHEHQGLVVLGGPRASGLSTSLRAMRRWALDVAGVPSAHRQGGVQLLAAGHGAEALRRAVAGVPQGHRVLAGAHLERAAHAFAHCRDHGVPLDAVSRHLLFVMAQRLVPRLCPSCRQPDHSSVLRETLARAANSWLGGAPIEAAQVRPQGCAHCQGSGLRGCVLVYEWLPADAGVRSMVEAGTIGLDLEQALFADGRSLWDHGLRQVACGLCSLAWLRRMVREPR